MAGRPVIAIYETIYGRTAEVLHPDTKARLGVVGYHRKADHSVPTAERGAWWFEDLDSYRSGSGYPTRDDAARALRGVG